jgi:ribosomal protein L11 methyltransferase
MKKYFKIGIKIISSEEAERIIAELSEISFYAFEEEKDLLMAYIKEEDFDEEKLKEILPDNANYIKNIIEEENWNKQWESGIQPVVINDFVAVRPSFHEPVENVKYDLIITPKMSFGTGHHATTFLMIELMEKIDFKNKTVLDFGTGTGVLAILAEKLGASKVIAIDNDEWSIANSAENIQANNCKHILIEQKQEVDGLGSFDIIMANINLNVLSNAAASISALLNQGAYLLVSGFLKKDELKITGFFEEKNIVKRKALQRGDWIAVCFKKSDG